MSSKLTLTGQKLWTFKNIIAINNIQYNIRYLNLGLGRKDVKFNFIL